MSTTETDDRPEADTETAAEGAAAEPKAEKPKLKLAVVEGQVFDGSQLKAVSELPTREDMIASIVGSIHAPISGIHGAINAVMRDVAMLVEEVAKKKAA